MLHLDHSRPHRYFRYLIQTFILENNALSYLKKQVLCFLPNFNQIPTPAFWEFRRPHFNPRYMKKSLVSGLCFRFILTKALLKHITMEHQIPEAKVLSIFSTSV